MWVYMLKNKNDSFSVFKKIRARVENEQIGEGNLCQVNSSYIARSMELLGTSHHHTRANKIALWKGETEM